MISESNNDIYGYNNEHAFIPTGVRLNSHSVAPTAPLPMNETLMFDDPDLGDYNSEFETPFYAGNIN